MTPTSRTTHLDLLLTARRVQQAAAEDDEAALHAELCELRNALVEHLHDERTGLHEERRIEHRLIRHGQDRLLRYLDGLLEATDDPDHACTCVVRAAELQAMLLRQVRLEQRITAHESARA